jgi:hypothetical protein
MDELGVAYEGSMDGKELWLDVGGKEVSVVPAFGDSLHALAPVKWRGGGAAKVLYPDDGEYPCTDQVGLVRFERFLLVGTEWYGQCSRVIDLETGETLHELPAGSRGAVVVPWPAD